MFFLIGAKQIVSADSSTKQHSSESRVIFWCRIWQKGTPQFNIAPENLPSQKEVVFQPSLLSG